MGGMSILESSRETGELLAVVLGRGEGGGGGRADGVEELVDGGALVVYVRVVEMVHGGVVGGRVGGVALDERGWVDGGDGRGTGRRRRRAEKGTRRERLGGFRTWCAHQPGPTTTPPD